SMSGAARADTLDGQSALLAIEKYRALLAAAASISKDEALALLDQSIAEARQDSRKATFIFEEDDSDETSSNSVEANAQFPPLMEEIRPTLERTIEELTIDHMKKVQLLPGDLIRLLNRGIVKHRDLESLLPDYETAVAVRRAFVEQNDKQSLAYLPHKGYDYPIAKDACCENMVGFMTIPVGVAGPLQINGGTPLMIPMATTEGALIASTNRGCSAIMRSGGVTTSVREVGMTRAPVVQFERPDDAFRLQQWLKVPENYDKMKSEFEAKSRFAKMEDIDIYIDGRLAHLRFRGKTGDAMGMNMISKATSDAMKHLQSTFQSAMKVVALSGNMCTDKKAANINWIKGRGRSAVAECVLPAAVVSKVLKTTPAAMAEAARAKFDSGSTLAGTIGGANAQAANVVAAIFIATGQDPAQVVSSSMCRTTLEVTSEGSLRASVTMPCIECGTVGGGTILPAQKQLLKLLKVAGPSPVDKAGTNANTLAEIIAATVLAGELSLMAALCTDDLVKSHLKLNRSRLNLEEQVSSSQPIIQLNRPQQQLNTIRGKSSEHTIKVNCSSIL
ncbi:hypothetical protein PENTCL1PPCAC_27472, partial [Pristionchus entomophagus]